MSWRMVKTKLIYIMIKNTSGGFQLSSIVQFIYFSASTLEYNLAEYNQSYLGCIHL